MRLHVTRQKKNVFFTMCVCRIIEKCLSLCVSRSH